MLIMSRVILHAKSEPCPLPCSLLHCDLTVLLLEWYFTCYRQEVSDIISVKRTVWDSEVTMSVVYNH